MAFGSPINDTVIAASYDAFNHGVFRLVGNYEWSEAKKGVHLSGPGHGPQCKAVASDDLETHALSHRVATELLHRVWTVRIKIFKTSGCCIPAVQSLRAYGYVAHQCPDELARRVLTSWFRLQHPQRPPEAPPTVDPLEASSVSSDLLGTTRFLQIVLFLSIIYLLVT